MTDLSNRTTEPTKAQLKVLLNRFHSAGKLEMFIRKAASPKKGKKQQN